MGKHHILKTPGNSYEEREKYWENVITKARSYPGGVTQFCRDYQIRKDNYYQWFKRLKLKHPEWNERVPTGAPKRKKGTTEFIPVIVKNDVEPAEATDAEDTEGRESSNSIEFHTSEGHVILFPEGADPEMFQMLLKEIIARDD